MSEKTEQEPTAGADLTEQQDPDAAAPAAVGDAVEPERSESDEESGFDADAAAHPGADPSDSDAAEA